jgi:hypothetical protein
MATQIPTTIEIHDRVLKMYALRYLTRHQEMDFVLYFEMYCTGPVINEMVRARGCETIMEELETKIKELR